MAEVSWSVVRKHAEKRRDAAMKELLGCRLDQVERIRGRIEAYNAVIALEAAVSDRNPETVNFLDSPLR